MVVAVVLAVSLVIVTFWFHYLVLRWLSGGMARIAMAAGVEAPNGLLLIVWSGSFIYIAMGRLWPWQTCAEPAGIAKAK